MRCRLLYELSVRSAVVIVVVVCVVVLARGKRVRNG